MWEKPGERTAAKMSIPASHLADVLPVVIELEQKEHGAADDQQRQNGCPVHARHPETMHDNVLLMTTTHTHALCSPLMAVKSRRCATKDRAGGCDRQRHHLRKKKEPEGAIVASCLDLHSKTHEYLHWATAPSYGLADSKVQTKQRQINKTSIEDHVLSKNVNHIQ